MITISQLKYRLYRYIKTNIMKIKKEKYRNGNIIVSNEQSFYNRALTAEEISNEYHKIINVINSGKI